MKLKTALEIGLDCGLENVGEAIYNIRFHAANIFNYGEEQKEYDEIIDEVKSMNLKSDTMIVDALNMIKE